MYDQCLRRLSIKKNNKRTCFPSRPCGPGSPTTPESPLGPAGPSAPIGPKHRYDALVQISGYLYKVLNM